MEKTVESLANVVDAVVAGNDLVLQRADAFDVESDRLADLWPLVQVNGAAVADGPRAEQVAGLEGFVIGGIGNQMACQEAARG